ncbi:hypothetical protein [Halorubrum coriense]|uniref:hypothetical protein n=1 Tax=Halorubrum coriense TaxID=64713 RepID=UPI000B064D64|nr:hypothetical protein [Halorubrum coriense]QRG24177.1 hypothetical protein HrrHm1_340 [Halorubrum virus Humcor1]
MTDLELLLLGVALGAIPTSDLARLAVAAIGKQVGVEPAEIRKYNAATGDDAGDGDE